MASNDPPANSTRRTPVYVHPASHAGGPSGPTSTVAYGSRLRLRADFPVNLYNPAAQVILRTMQRYGIVLSDGGNIALTAEDDIYTTHKWSELNISSRLFDQAVPSAPLRTQDFSLIDTGPRIVETYDCVRNAEPSASIPNTLTSQIKRTHRNGALLVNLSWLAGGARVDIYRDGVFRTSVDNTNRYAEKLGKNLRPSFVVCNVDTNDCSNAAMAAPHQYIDPPRQRPQQVFQSNK